MSYYALLENLITALNSPKEADPEEVNAILGEICALFRVEKAEICFYQSPTHEKLGRGESFVCYDGGHAERLVYRDRRMTPTLMIGICNVYQRGDAEPLSPEEEERVKRIADMMLNHVMTRRVRATVEMLTFIDDDGYHNTRYFTSQLQKMGHMGLLPGMAAARFNLKHFSIINQQVGRAAGNLVMQNYFNMLSDAVQPGGFVCRLGGDNFVLLCGRDQLQKVVQIFSGVPVVYDSNTQEQLIVSSVAGVLIIPDHFEFDNPGDIMDKIITAYNDARRSGKEDIAYCNDDFMTERERMMRIQNLFPVALEREEFLVYYQPKIDVYGNMLAGAEALCRWLHRGKIIPPMEFIPILEQNLDICKLDFYMLEHVCRDIRRWLDEGRQVVRVSVNLSRKHMLDTHLFDHIVSIIDKYNVPHKYIEIELTETTTDVEFRDLKRVVNGLQNVGIYTSVDDFGIGYSSLNLIREIPWNVLKVDKSFVPTDEEDDRSRSSIIFKHVIAMAHDMGLECVAEGVETQEQIDILKKNSCHIAQGFYFDKPLPINEFEDRLGKQIYNDK